MADATQMVQATASNKTPAHEIEAALQALALNSGALGKTCRELGMPESTLCEWRKRNMDRYQQIEAEVIPQLYERIAAKSEALAMDQAEAEAEMLEDIRARRDEMKPGEASTALRNVAVAKALNIDKASAIRGRPSQITEHREVKVLLTGMAHEFSDIISVKETDVVELDD